MRVHTSLPLNDAHSGYRELERRQRDFCQATSARIPARALLSQDLAHKGLIIDVTVAEGKDPRNESSAFCPASRHARAQIPKHRA